MNYINKGKRDILLFPEFSNIEKIQKIREKYDELADIIFPHITIAFPFELENGKDDLREKIKSILKEQECIAPFKIKCKGISLKWDDNISKYYIFLNISQGREQIVKLHSLMYKYVLEKEFKYSYEPHITLGCVNKIEDFNIELNDSFECIIDKIYVERIGENEESIIESVINLFDN